MFLVADETATPVIIAGRALADYRPMVFNPRHDHSTTTGVVGYALRHTIHDGRIIRNGEQVGVDVAAIAGSHRYGDMFPLRDAYRAGRDYAVVDSLYGCGCRSGN